MIDATRCVAYIARHEYDVCSFWAPPPPHPRGTGALWRVSLPAAAGPKVAARFSPVNPFALLAFFRRSVKTLDED